MLSSEFLKLKCDACCDASCDRLPILSQLKLTASCDSTNPSHPHATAGRLAIAGRWRLATLAMAGDRWPLLARLAMAGRWPWLANWLVVASRCCCWVAIAGAASLLATAGFFAGGPESLVANKYVATTTKNFSKF